MLLSQLKGILHTAEGVDFRLPNGSYVPEHFHVTEVGISTKRFVDCGGTMRTEHRANFQLWSADDYEHRLKPGKLLHIIALAEKALGMADLQIEVEYETDTIGRFGLHWDGRRFQLLPTNTACLSGVACSLPAPAATMLPQSAATCTPGGGCC